MNNAFTFGYWLDIELSGTPFLKYLVTRQNMATVIATMTAKYATDTPNDTLLPVLSRLPYWMMLTSENMSS